MRQGVVQGQVHLFRVGGQDLALDVASGSLHLVDAVAREVIAGQGRGMEPSALKERFGHGAVARAVDEVEELKSCGLLFTPDPVPQEPRELPLVKALCMNVAHDCDLVCGYCFAQQGGFGGERRLMTQSTAAGAIDWLAGQADSPTLAVDFFGGEPLLNLPAVRAAVERARLWEQRTGIQFNFTITTNGTRLDETVGEFLQREAFRVVLSLDGRPPVHDRFRKTPGGEGSYERVIANMLRFIGGRHPDTYYARGTYTRYNLDFTQDVIHLADEGFASISLEPVVAGEECPWALTEADMEACFEEYEKLAQVYIRRHRGGRPFGFFHFDIDLEHGPCLSKRLRGCGAGSEYLAVAPDGRFYPCHQLVGEDAFLLGSVEAGVGAPKLREDFARTHALTKDECAQCWARYHCGGGCHANAYHFNGDIARPYDIGCQLQRKRLECALYVQAMLSVTAN